MQRSGSASTQDLLTALSGALAARDRRRVDQLVAGLIASDAPLGGQWRALARVSRQNGASNNARAAMENYVRQGGSTPALRFEQAALLAELGDFAAAQSTLDALPVGFPDSATRSHFAGTLALNLGDAARAAECFRTVLAVRPRSGQTWLSFAEGMRSADPQHWAPLVLKHESAMAGAPPAEQGAYLYALGNAHHALRDPDRAFAAFAKGAQLVKRLRPYDIGADRASVEQARAAPVPGSSARRDARPIFVFGPPRSGTTLVEQILASHSAVSGGGEVGLFDIIVRDIGGLTERHFQAALGRWGADSLARDYLQMLTERFGADGRIVDKTLTSTRYAGLLAALLPDAPLIWVRRDPLDNGWSCFHTHFNQGMHWSWDQKDIAVHLRLEADMLEFWAGHLGDRLLVLDYDALTASPQKVIPQLLEHCGLAAEPQVFEPHKTDRPVITASVSQVREPINRKGVGAAAPYRRHLQPFIEAYGYPG